jgi:hypothetical protein
VSLLTFLGHRFSTGEPLVPPCAPSSKKGVRGGNMVSPALKGRQGSRAPDSANQHGQARLARHPAASGVSLSRSPAPLVNIGSVGGPGT